MGNIINRLKDMDFEIINTYNIDTTITNFYHDINDDCFKIECNPSYDIMTLHRTNPNFIKIYGLLKVGNTYNFTCSNWIYDLDEIVAIKECEIIEIDDVVIGHLDIQHELNTLKHYDEIVLKNVIKKRLLINKNVLNEIIIGRNYKIKSIKKFGDNFYDIIDYKLI